MTSRWLGSVFAALALAVPVLAQDRYAILVGIDRYRELPDLERAHASAVVMRRALASAGWQTRLLPRATTVEAFRDAMRRLSGAITPDDLVLVFFAGHGTATTRGRNVLCFSDTSPQNLSRSDQIDVEGLQRQLSLMARNPILILDTPFRTRGGQLTAFRPQSEQGPVSMFFATRPGGYSVEPAGVVRDLDGQVISGSTFAHFVATGLRTAAVRDRGMTTRELAAFVEEQVRRHERGPTPIVAPMFVVRHDIELVEPRSGTEAAEARTVRRAQDLLGEAERSMRDEDYERAESRLREVFELGREIPESARLAMLRGEATLRMGLAIERGAARIRDEDARRSRQSAAEDAWRSLINADNVPLEQRLFARLYLGQLLLDQGRFAAASDVLQTSDATRFAPNVRFAWFYNQARARELADRPDRAIESYRYALAVDPGSELAVRHLCRLVRERKPSAWIRTATVATQGLMESGNATVAGNEALACLDAAAEGAPTLGLVHVFVRYLTVNQETPETFSAKYRTRLERRTRADTEVGRAVSELFDAFFATDLADSVKASNWQSLWPDRFRAWSSSEEGRPVFSRLLMHLGDYHAQVDAETRRAVNPREALARYLAAWTLDRDNVEACVRAVGSLRGYRADDAGDLYRSVMSEVRNEKSSAYLIPTKDADDWRRIRRLHVLLGSIYEDEGPLGDGPQDVWSALGQWSRAVEADRRIEELSDGYRRSWRLVARYAAVLGKAGNEDASREQQALADRLRGR